MVSIRNDMCSRCRMCNTWEPVENAQPRQIVSSRVEEKGHDYGNAAAGCEILNVVGCWPAAYPLKEAEQKRAAVQNGDRQEVHQGEVNGQDGHQRKKRVASSLRGLTGQVSDPDNAPEISGALAGG